jgi:N-carbamoyl-L-amino-acid hydrolase
MNEVAAAVNEQRQWLRLMEWSELGAIPGNGVNRPCLSPLDRAARRLLIDWARDIGAAVSVDEAANLWLRRAGREDDLAPVLTGSHMDTQPAGGRFDGAYGVMAGLEVLQALHDAGHVTRRPIEVVAWTNEEGSRFAPGCTGSMSWAGVHPSDFWDEVTDHNGVAYGRALAEQLAAEADLPRRALGSRPFAYIEAHIEQGPLLEAEGLDIGVVTGIQGSRWFTVTIEGASAHAGTAPVGLRRDAVQDMVRAIAALNALTEDPEDVLRFTVGRVNVSPNSSNSVAERVTFSIDLRHPDEAVLRAKGDAIAAVVQGAVRHCRVSVVENFHAMPAAFAPEVIAVVEKAAAEAGASYRRMPSGAFHDAQFVIPVAPSGMIFVPSRAGISHNPAEYTAPAQLAVGTRVLARALVALAEG